MISTVPLPSSGHCCFYDEIRVYKCVYSNTGNDLEIEAHMHFLRTFKGCRQEEHGGLSPPPPYTLFKVLVEN